MKDDDIELVCMDCGQRFYFTKGEQDFFKSKGFSNPKRCMSCRTKKKQQRGGDTQ